MAYTRVLELSEVTPTLLQSLADDEFEGEIDADDGVLRFWRGAFQPTERVKL